MNTEAISYDVGPALERFGGDRDFLAECVDLLKAEIPPLMSSLRDSIGKGAPEQAHAAAHALKGMTSNFCEQGPAATAAQLVEVARAGQLTTAPQLLARLEREIAGLLESLQAATAH
jgi:HPt (histidine-containing phosphotransfer) domain-containing protein